MRSVVGAHQALRGDRSELPALEIDHRLTNLVGGVHDEGAVHDDGLVDRLAAEDQQGGVAIGFDPDQAALPPSGRR